MFSPITRATSGSHKLWMMDYNKKPCQGKVQNIFNSLKITKVTVVEYKLTTMHSWLFT